MNARARVLWLLSATSFLVAPTGASAEGIGDGEKPAWMDKSRNAEAMQVVDKLGEKAPLDVAMTDHEGKATTLGAYLKPDEDGAGKPVLLVLAYYECPMLCSLVLNGVLDAVKPIDLLPGEDFEVVVLSIDPEETPALAAKKRESYLKAYSRDEGRAGWHFHTAKAEESKRLAEAVGFNYFFDEKSEQWAHGAGIFFLAPDGTVARTLTGVEFAPQDIKFALIDASNGKVGSLVDRIVMSCFHYEPDAHKYGFYIWGAVRMVGLLVVISLGALLISLWRRERIRKGPAAC